MCCKYFGILASLKIYLTAGQVQWRLFMCLYCSLYYEIPVVSVGLWSSLFALSLWHDSGHPLSKTPITSVGLVQALGAVITQLTNASKFLEICRGLWLHTVPENLGLVCAQSCFLRAFKGLNVIVVYPETESVIILVSLITCQEQVGSAQHFQWKNLLCG